MNDISFIIKTLDSFKEIWPILCKPILQKAVEIAEIENKYGDEDWKLHGHNMKLDLPIEGIHENQFIVYVFYGNSVDCSGTIEVKKEYFIDPNWKIKLIEQLKND